MPQLKVLPGWYVDNNVARREVKVETPLSKAIEYILNVRMELQASTDYGMDVGSVEDLLEDAEELLSDPDIYPTANELGYEAESLDDEDIEEMGVLIRGRFGSVDEDD